MQLHMFWALYIHAADAQEVQGDPDKQEDVWNDLRNLRRLFWEWPWHKGELALRHVPALDETLENYATRGAYDEFWASKENDFTRYWHRPRRCPGDDDDRLVRRLPALRHRVLRRDGRAEHVAAAADRRTVEPRGHARRRDLDARRRLRPDVALGSRSATSTSSCALRRWLPDEAAGQPPDEPPVQIFVMGGGTGRKTALGKLDHGGRWRDEQEWPLARAQARDVASARGRRARGRASAAGEPRRSPTTRTTPCRRSAATTARSASSRRRARGWSRCGCGCSTRLSCCGTS